MATTTTTATTQETRAQFIVALAKAMNISPDTSASASFSDVSSSSSDFGYIEAAVKAGWLNGFPDGTFKPDSGITREQMVKVEINALGLQSAANSLASTQPSFSDWNMIGKWDWGNLNETVKIGVIKGFTNGTLGPSVTFTPAQANDATTQLKTYQQSQNNSGHAAISNMTLSGQAVGTGSSGITGR